MANVLKNPNTFAHREGVPVETMLKVSPNMALHGYISGYKTMLRPVDIDD